MSGQSTGKFRVAVVSSAESGGAGIAAKRVHRALNGLSEFRSDFVDVASVGGTVPHDAAPRGSFNNRKISDTHFTVEFPGHVRGWMVELLDQYDLLNVHWASYMISLGELAALAKSGKPILFTLHDYYYITGGCHYPAICTQYVRSCLACPQVDRKRVSVNTISRNRQLKSAILSNRNVHVAAPSRFLVDEAVQSGLVPRERAHVLRNPYSPISEASLSAPDDRPRIALMADSFSERRKNMELAIKAIAETRRRMEHESGAATGLLVEVIGGVTVDLDTALKDADVAYVQHGKLSSHSDIINVLCKCDCLLTCSSEDNWPNVLVEACSYGVIPVVGPGHGCEEFVKEVQVGFVAQEYAAEAFATEIVKAITVCDGAEVSRLRRAVRDLHSPEKVARDYEVTMMKVRKDASIVREGGRTV